MGCYAEVVDCASDSCRRLLRELSDPAEERPAEPGTVDESLPAPALDARRAVFAPDPHRRALIVMLVRGGAEHVVRGGQRSRCRCVKEGDVLRVTIGVSNQVPGSPDREPSNLIGALSLAPASDSLTPIAAPPSSGRCGSSVSSSASSTSDNHCTAVSHCAVVYRWALEGRTDRDGPGAVATEGLEERNIVLHADAEATGSRLGELLPRGATRRRTGSTPRARTVPA